MRRFTTFIFGEPGRPLMKPDHLKRFARSGIGALLLLLFQGFFAPQVVSAGCSHLVTSRLDPSLEITRLSELLVAPTTLVSSDDPTRYPNGQRSPKPRTPCSGMNCSSGVPLPVSTTSTEPRNIDQWGTLSASLLRAPGRAFNRGAEQPDSHESGYRPSVFHPPPR